MTLHELGWDDQWQQAWIRLREPDWEPLRIITGGQDIWWASDGARQWHVCLGGTVRHESRDTAGTHVAVGDWVAARLPPGDGVAALAAILPRRSCLARKWPGDRSEVQVLAANMQYILLVFALDGRRGFTARGLTRYLALAQDSQAAPVIILNKSDLCDDPRAAQEEIQAVAPDLPLHVVCATQGQGLEALAPYLAQGITSVLLGPSGAGKSTLLNRLAGQELQTTTEVREKDQRGRHTTSARRLVRLPAGGLVIDTPGLRELQLHVDAHTEQLIFPDIAEWAVQCRFTDCRHEQEPGCAVRQALEAGRLLHDRFTHFLELREEAERQQARAQSGSRRTSTKRWRAHSEAAHLRHLETEER